MQFLIRAFKVINPRLCHRLKILHLRGRHFGQVVYLGYYFKASHQLNKPPWAHYTVKNLAIINNKTMGVTR